MEQYLALFFTICAVATAEQSCQSFADGEVYPRESSETSAHELQVSKARSKSNNMSDNSESVAGPLNNFVFTQGA